MPLSVTLRHVLRAVHGEPHRHRVSAGAFERRGHLDSEDASIRTSLILHLISFRVSWVALASVHRRQKRLGAQASHACCGCDASVVAHRPQHAPLHRPRSHCFNHQSIRCDQVCNKFQADDFALYRGLFRRHFSVRTGDALQQILHRARI